MRVRVKIDKNKLNHIKEQLKPEASILSLVGIIFFFFVPEIVAFFWGERVKGYFYSLSKLYHDGFMQKACIEAGDMFSENSILNILIGFGFVWWWFSERKKV